MEGVREGVGQTECGEGGEGEMSKKQSHMGNKDQSRLLIYTSYEIPRKRQ